MLAFVEVPMVATVGANEWLRTELNASAYQDFTGIDCGRQCTCAAGTKMVLL